MNPELLLTKLEKITKRSNRIQEKIRELAKQGKILDLQARHINETLEIIKLSDQKELQDGTEAPGVRASNAVVLANDEKAQARKPKPTPKGPACRSCGAVGKLFQTSRTLSNGKLVPLCVCDECKTEQVMF